MKRTRQTAQPARRPLRRIGLSLVALLVIAAFSAVLAARLPSPAAPALASSGGAGTGTASDVRGDSPGSPGGSARPAEAPSALERAVLEDLNRMREDPRAYARLLFAERRWYDGRLFRRPGRIPVQTIEGLDAVDETIRALAPVAPLPPLAHSPGLARAARAHAMDIGSAGARGHAGTDGTPWRERLARFGRFTGLAGEVISFGQDEAVRVVRQLLVDDGVPDRGHRVNLLRSEFRLAGVACTTHKTMRSVCVIELASSFDGP